MDLYLLINAVVAVHLAYVTFVVVGMAAILTGLALRWSWVRNFWFRTIHLLMIAIVVFESLCGIVCPLTVWEDRLREAVGEENETGSFIADWLHDLMFVSAPPWVLTICYVVFGLAVLAAFVLAPPRRPRFLQK